MRAGAFEDFNISDEAFKELESLEVVYKVGVELDNDGEMVAELWAFSVSEYKKVKDELSKNVTEEVDKELEKLRKRFGDFDGLELWIPVYSP